MLILEWEKDREGKRVIQIIHLDITPSADRGREKVSRGKMEG